MKRREWVLSPTVASVVVLLQGSIRLRRHEDHDKQRTAENGAGTSGYPARQSQRANHRAADSRALSNIG
jgi:hypothetical protein